jgi:hypothetical protein
LTLIELMALMLWAGIGVAGAMLGSRWAGPGGAALGAVSGMALPAAVAWVLSKIWVITSRDRPSLPPCRRGRCEAAQYTVSWIDRELVYRCGCGDHYRFAPRRSGRARFVWMSSQREVVPYMSHTTWGPWEAE